MKPVPTRVGPVGDEDRRQNQNLSLWNVEPKAASSRKGGGVSGREPASQGCPAGPAGHSSVLRPWLQVTTCPLHAVTSRQFSPGL